MTTGACKLCGNVDTLRESHIVPRFVYQWMRKTGGTYFRGIADPTSREQDGNKEYLLCGPCEQRFSSRETYFKTAIFDPYVESSTRSMSYDERLFYFLTSVMWRVLVHEMAQEGINAHPFITPLREAELEWRQYLLDAGASPKRFNEVHLFLTDVSANRTQPVDGLNLYMARAVDGTIVHSTSACAIYAKFSRFVLFAAITPFDETLWINTRISPSGGTLLVPQEIRDGHLGRFMIGRARMVAESSRTPLTEKQKQFYDEILARNPERFLNSDLGKVMLADLNATIDPHVLYPKDKIGRNERCPCGSGLKYKKCHGKS